jgi:osmotically-inducible protein OsmY
MNLLSRGSYADERLETAARQALAADPLIPDADVFAVTSSKGIIQLRGTAHREEEKQRIETVIANALRTTGLKYDHIANELRVAGT